MSKVAIIGDKTSVLGFTALGLDAYPVVDMKEARDIWLRIKDRDYGVLFVTEPVYLEIKDLLAEVAEELKPAVVVIPPTTGGVGLGLQRLRRIVEKAVGVDILAKEEEE
ncbi:MAG: V-type ATP synthase subunit F [Actinomycetota bacterium]|nr:V-type ATP synthase subunit F [Actinomycetota bacterium]